METLTQTKKMELIENSNQFFNDIQSESKHFDDETLLQYLNRNSKLIDIKSKQCFEPKEKYSITKQHNDYLDNEVKRLVDENFVKFYFVYGDKHHFNSWDIFLNVGSYIKSLEKNLGQIKVLFSRNGISFYYEKSEWFKNRLNQIKHSNDDLSLMDYQFIMMEELVIESIKKQIPKLIKFINKSVNGNLDEKGDYKIYSGFSKYFNRSLITNFFRNKMEYKIYRSYIMGKFNLITKSEFRNFINNKNFEFRGMLNDTNTNHFQLQNQLFE